MIKQIFIQNFQSHKSSVIEFVNGVNCIVGSSDSGKTAIFRAFNWLLTNRPLGDDFKSNWGGDTKVIITKNDFITVGRDKGKANRYYILETDDKGEPVTDLIEFKAVDASVPKEVSDALNLSSINVQNQLDAPFLLSLSAGKVAQILNNIARLEDIDISQGNIISSLRKIKQDIVYKQNTLETTQSSLNEFDYLDEAEETLDALNARIDDYTKNLSALETVRLLILQLGTLKREIDIIDEYIVDENEIDDALSMSSNLKLKILNKTNIASAINNIKKVQIDIDNVNELLTNEAEINSLMDKRGEIVLLNEKYNQLKAVFSGIEHSEKILSISKIDLRRLEKQFKELMPDICPLCGK